MASSQSDGIISNCDASVRPRFILVSRWDLNLGQMEISPETHTPAPRKSHFYEFNFSTCENYEPEKNSNPRILNVSNKLIGMLEALPRKSERIFGAVTTQTLSGLFKTQREKIVRKLNNPRLSKITFHTLRHWKATMEYHKTKDIIHVQQLLGHKSINSTLKYISIEKALFKTDDDHWITRVAKSIEDARNWWKLGLSFTATSALKGNCSGSGNDTLIYLRFPLLKGK